jgi:hypothetical protein
MDSESNSPIPLKVAVATKVSNRVRDSEETAEATVALRAVILNPPLLRPNALLEAQLKQLFVSGRFQI